MISSLRTMFKVFWKTDHERSDQVKKNIVYIFLIKALSVLITFILIPLTIHYLDTGQNGIWLTISSMVAWINTFDIGLSNGLRNKITEAYAVEKKENFAAYTSTTYLLLIVIAGFIFLLFFSVGSFFNWNELLKVNDVISYDIWPLLVTTLALFCIQFILQPVNSILVAIHQPFKSSLIFLAGQLLTLIAICLFMHYTKGNLFILVLIAGGAPIVVLFLSSIYLFGTTLKNFRPSFRLVDFKSAKNLLNLGTAFFFIQIGALILYQTDNIIITRTLGPAEVTTFNIAFKYFSIVNTLFFIILTPYWSAFTDAYVNGDYAWIKQSMKKMRKLWAFFAVTAVIMYFFAAFFYKLWIGATIPIPNFLSLSMAVYVIIQTWTLLHSYLLNGTGKLRIELLFVVGTAIVNIPLSVLLIKYVGIAGTVLSNCAVLFVMNIFLTYQCGLIVNKKATGIWNR